MNILYTVTVAVGENRDTVLTYDFLSYDEQQKFMGGIRGVPGIEVMKNLTQKSISAESALMEVRDQMARLKAIGR